MISDFGFRISDFGGPASFRFAEHLRDFDAKWWRALKDPPTNGARKPVGGSFRARNHDDPVPEKGQREYRADGRKSEIRNPKSEISGWVGVW